MSEIYNNLSGTSFDELGDYCKAFEKLETTRRAKSGEVLIARLDGRAFHSITKNMERPFDGNFTKAMVDTTQSLVKEFHANVGYTQSDEISLAWVNSGVNYEHPFGGKFHKINSVLASHASCVFNSYFPGRWSLPALFDSRSFAVHTVHEALKVFIWRQWDARRNSINMLAHTVFSNKVLHGVGTGDRLAMLADNGFDWHKTPDMFKYGVFITKKEIFKLLDAETLAKIPLDRRPTEPVIRKEISPLIEEIMYSKTPIETLFGIPEPVPVSKTPIETLFGIPESVPVSKTPIETLFGISELTLD